MKIALPATGNKVDGHFGHCEQFVVFTVNESKEITAQQRIDPPCGCGCKSNIVAILADMGVTVMLAGNMGEGAVQVLGQAGIQVVRGCQGDVTEVVRAYLDGAIADSGIGCHQHGHDCGHH